MPRAMYSVDKVLQLQLKPSPSLAYNNLFAFGQGLAYSHTRAVGVRAWQQRAVLPRAQPAR